MFHDEDFAYAALLRSSGVPCEVLVVPGMYHAAGVTRPDAATARRFRRAAVDTLRTAYDATATNAVKNG